MKNQTGLIVVGLCIALAGYFVYLAIDNLSARERVVSAKGLSERTVPADKAVWNISYCVTGNVVESLYNRLEAKKNALVTFLKKNGISDKDIVYAPAVATDRSTWYDWNEEKAAKMEQYVLTGHLTVVSGDVEKIRKLQLRQQDLLSQGVVLEGSSVTYEYTGLNSLKPDMVEEATSKARLVADKFAEDAGCTLGSIKTARQGQFEVESDEILPHMNHIRVVTTIEYYLK